MGTVPHIAYWVHYKISTIFKLNLLLKENYYGVARAGVSVKLVLLFVNSCKSLILTFFNSVGFFGSLHSQAVLL